MVIRKYILIKILEILKEYGCNTLDEAITKINEEIPNDTDIAFRIDKANGDK